ncbi:MAG: ComEC/Rec2 family competence protein [Bacillus subtilis]|nr:ComEC/Rec2 family competence protein [Bacillus subtilis]
MLFGSDDSLDPDWIASVRSIGIAHLFAISGMHLTLMLAFLRLLWRKLFWREDRFVVLQIGFLLLYNILAGWSISLLRASALAMIFTLPGALKRFAKLDLLTLAMGGFMIVNPVLIHHLGFQLSFLISASLFLIPPKEERESAIAYALRVSTIAALLSLPIVAGINHQISLFQIPVNVVFTAAVAYGLLPLSVLTLAISPFDSLYAVVANIFQDAVAWVEAGSIFIRIPLRGGWNVLYWLVLLAFLRSWLSRRQCWKSGFGLILVVLCASFASAFDPTTQVHILDVNQGDAIHISGKGCQMLIDTGNVDKHDGLVRYFQRKGITRLDVVVITHNHADHYGELGDLANAIEIDRLIHGSPLVIPYSGSTQTAKIGDFIGCGRIVLEVLWSDSGSLNPNNNSLVLYGRIGTDNWLFMADAEALVEMELIDSWQRDVDRLKVGHHGSSTSTSVAFWRPFNRLTQSYRSVESIDSAIRPRLFSNGCLPLESPCIERIIKVRFGTSICRRAIFASLPCMIMTAANGWRKSSTCKFAGKGFANSGSVL